MASTIFSTSYMPSIASISSTPLRSGHEASHHSRFDRCLIGRRNLIVSSRAEFSLSLSDQNEEKESKIEGKNERFLTRRDALVSAASTMASLPLLRSEEANAIPAVAVGSYLPLAGQGDLVLFSPGPKDTPALRAGNVAPYSFFLPPTWTQARIANILSGNYCQPKCAEPWIEVKFESPKQGTLLVVASPLVRLTNKPTATIEQIGEPEQIIAALGPFVTGDSYDPEELVEVSVRKDGDQTYYDYVLETPYARSGQHNLASATAKESTVLLLVVSATDAQWASSEDLLRQLVKSFSV